MGCTERRYPAGRRTARHAGANARKVVVRSVASSKDGEAR